LPKAKKVETDLDGHSTLRYPANLSAALIAARIPFTARILFT